MLCGERPFSWLTHIVATLTILGVVLMLAIFVPDIRNVFGIVGEFVFKSLCDLLNILIFFHWEKTVKTAMI